MSALFVLDGIVQYNRADTAGALADKRIIRIFSGTIRPGSHTLQVRLNLQGNGSGVFAYLKTYHFEPRSSHSFTAGEGRILALETVAYERGGLTTPVEDRLAIRYQEVQCDAIEHRDATTDGSTAPVDAGVR